MDMTKEFDEFRQDFARALEETGKAVVGHKDLITDVLTAMFAGGHVLLEGVPGLGKTHLVKTLSNITSLNFGRVQCTPDLMPSDVLGTHIIRENDEGKRMFWFEKGPVFANLLLVDEVNRATPKTQSALLEVMQEHHVTAGSEVFEVDPPFFVLATQNPLEMEGTYPLPEAQLDRFCVKLLVAFPDLKTLVEISDKTTGTEVASLSPVLSGEKILKYQKLQMNVPVAEPLTYYAASIVLASHPDMKDAPEKVQRYVSYGASPRGLQSIIRVAKIYCLLDNRMAVSVDDIRKAAHPALRHRIILNFEGEAEALAVDSLIDDILKEIPTPAEK